MTSADIGKKAIEVSVIVPAYNAAGVIISCLNALQSQEINLCYEIIVVDDGSNDNTAELAEAKGVKVIRHKEKRGAAAARNSGIEVALGEIICFTDADAIPKNNWIEQILQPFSNEEIIGVKGTYATNQRNIVARFVQIEYEDKYDLMLRKERINFIDTYSAAYRRKVLKANHGFDEKIQYVKDQELSFRLAARGYQMVFHPTAVVFHMHTATLPSYFRKKFMIGYWKAKILRRFPGRAVQDSHTPQVIKLQILLVAFLLIAAAAVALTRWSAIAVATLVAAFLASAVPFLVKAWYKDRVITFAAPLLLAARAVALGFGYAWGLLRINPEIGPEHTIVGMNFLSKRMMDIIGGIIGTLLMLFSWPLVALAIKIDSKGPAFLGLERVGQEGKLIAISRFRSEPILAEEELSSPDSLGFLPEPTTDQLQDQDLTRVGRFLHRWSLDRLPEFLTVLKGDMSLVGPYPEKPGNLAQYSDWHRRRLAVKPGMTGPLQLNGHLNLPLDKRVQLELEYIENYSFWRDIVIIWETLSAVTHGRGLSELK